MHNFISIISTLKSLLGNLRVFKTCEFRKRACVGTVAMADRKRSGGYSDDYDSKRPRS